MKRCCHCKVEKSLESFGKDRNTKDGLKKVCKSCLSMAYKEYHRNHPEKAKARCDKWRQSNRDRVNEIARINYHRHPEHSRATQKKYAKAHPEKVSQSQKEYHRKDGMRDHYRNLQNAWRKTDRGRKLFLLSLQKRRTNAEKVTNDLTDTDISLLLGIQDGKCACCQRRFSERLRYTLDHILPLSMGGGLTRKNVQLLCRSCNSSKSARHILYRRLLPDEVA